MDDQQIKLRLTVEGTQNVVAMADASGRLRDEMGRFVSAGGSAEKAVARATEVMQVSTHGVYELADAYEMVGHGAEKVVSPVRRLDAALDPVTHAMEELAQRSDRAAVSVGKVDTAAKATDRGMSLLNQRMTAGSYMFQDFTSTSGDLGAKFNSISNNIPQLMAGMGGLGIAVGIAGTAAIVLYRSWDSISSLWETRNPIPKVSGSAEVLDESLKGVNKQLDAMKEKGSLNNAELVRFNDLTKEQIKLEGELKAAKEYEALAKSHDEHSNEGDKTRGQAVGKAIDFMGGTESLVKQLVDDYVKKYGLDEEGRAGAEKFFKERLLEASKGDAKAIRDISGHKTGAGDMFASALARNDPNEEVRKKKAQDDADAKDDAWQAGIDKLAEKGKERREKAKAAAAKGESGKRGDEAVSDTVQGLREKQETDEKKKADAKAKQEKSARDKAHENLVANSDVDEQAADAAVRLKADGKGTREQQRQFLLREVMQRLQREGWAPGAAKQEAGRIASDAFSNVETRLRDTQQVFKNANFDEKSSYARALEQTAETIAGLAVEAAQNSVRIDQIGTFIAGQNPRQRTGRKR